MLVQIRNVRRAASAYLPRHAYYGRDDPLVAAMEFWISNFCAAVKVLKFTVWACVGPELTTI